MDHECSVASHCAMHSTKFTSLSYHAMVQQGLSMEEPQSKFEMFKLK